jgi:hypothetical protein
MPAIIVVGMPSRCGCVEYREPGVTDGVVDRESSTQDPSPPRTIRRNQVDHLSTAVCAGPRLKKGREKGVVVEVSENLAVEGTNDRGWRGFLLARGEWEDGREMNNEGLSTEIRRRNKGSGAMRKEWLQKERIWRGGS